MLHSNNRTFARINWNGGCFVRNPKTKNAGAELVIMNYFHVFYAGAGSSEESDSVSVCRAQPVEDGKKGAAEKS